MPGRRGALLLGDAARPLVSGLVHWGGPLATEMQFAPGDCWALRRRQTHVYSSAAPEVRCRHVGPRFDGITGCIPLMGHGTLAGLVYLEFEAGAEAGVPLLEDSAAAFCESVAVSLANFRLREAQRLQSIRDPLTGPRKSRPRPRGAGGSGARVRRRLNTCKIPLYRPPSRRDHEIRRPGLCF